MYELPVSVTLLGRRITHEPLIFMLIGSLENENDNNPRWRWTTGERR